MTFNTTIVIGNPLPVRELFDFCNGLLGAPADVKWKQQDCDGNRLGQREILNEPMQGLPAWLWIYYGADGPMRHAHTKYCATEVGPAKWDDDGKYPVTANDIAEHEAEIAADPTRNGWAAIEVTFDTAYGYVADDGTRCTQLHARYVAQFGAWLDKRGAPWRWQNEYTGEWFDGYDGLRDFAEDDAATGWFDSQVAPVLRSMGATW